MHDGGKQMREKAVSRSREHSKDVALCGLFAALVAVGAFIKVVIPTGADTMNFTLQWFFVMLAAFLLGSRRAFTSVGVYLLIGLAGVPIFARGGGPAYLLRPTFGFLLGFLLAASRLELQLINLIVADLLFVLVHDHDHLHGLTKDIDTVYLTLQAIVCGHIIAYIRKFTIQVLIGLFLIFQTAHQSSADTGDLGRI